MVIIPLAILHVDVGSSGADSGTSTLVAPPWKHTLGLRRVNQLHLDIYSGYRKKFLEPQGLAAIKHDFDNKQGSGDDAELTVYGVNQGSGEIFYNKSMTSLGFFGHEAGEERILRGAVGISADALGNVFVADSGNDRIVRLRNDERKRLRVVGYFDGADSGIPMRGPTDVVLEAGGAFVADTGNNRIVETDLEGRFVRALGREAELSEPFGIAALVSDDWNHHGSRFIAVTDSGNQRLAILSTDGVLIESIRYGEISDTKGGFFFVAVDYYSNIYVTDPIGGCIYKFDRNLVYVTRVGCGTGSKEDLVEPRGIAIYRRYGQVFVAEKGGASYFWVGTDVRNLRCTASRSGEAFDLNIRFLLTERSTVTIRLESEDGGVSETLSSNRLMRQGPRTLQYQVDRGHCPRANCKYRVTVEARATYSSREYFSVSRSAPVRGL
jgi:DNA-binding beta-propeller fold protein YncE